MRLSGAAEKVKETPAVGGIYALRPDDYYGMKPKVVVREGDTVRVDVGPDDQMYAVRVGGPSTDVPASDAGPDAEDGVDPDDVE